MNVLTVMTALCLLVCRNELFLFACLIYIAFVIFFSHLPLFSFFSLVFFSFTHFLLHSFPPLCLPGALVVFYEYGCPSNLGFLVIWGLENTDNCSLKTLGLLSDRYTFCQKCFNDIPGDTVTLGDDPTQPQT